MTTAAQKLTKAAEQKHTEVTVAIGREKTPVHNPKLAQAIITAFSHQGNQKASGNLLNKEKSTIIDEARQYATDTGTIRFLIDNLQVTITFGSEIKLTDEKKAREKLGKNRFADLVNTKTTYKPTDRFVQLASKDGADPALRELLEIKDKSPSVKFEYLDEKK